MKFTIKNIVAIILIVGAVLGWVFGTPHLVDRADQLIYSTTLLLTALILFFIPDKN